MSEQELRDEIKRLVKLGRTDLEISGMLDLKVKEVYRIRKTELKITNYGRKRWCVKCECWRSVTLFNLNKSKDCCTICLRREGKITPKERKPRKKQEPRQSINHFGYRITLCLRCNKSFESPVLSDDGRDYYRLCPTCRNFVVAQERISI